MLGGGLVERGASRLERKSGTHLLTQPCLLRSQAQVAFLWGGVSPGFRELEIVLNIFVLRAHTPFEKPKMDSPTSEQSHSSRGFCW